MCNEHHCTTNVAGRPLNLFCSQCNCLMLTLHMIRRVESCVTSKPCTGLYCYISVKARLVMTFLHWHFLQGQSHVRATQAVQLATHTPLITLNTHGRRLNATLTLVTFTLPLYSLPHVDRWSSSHFAEVTCLRTDEREARTGFSFLSHRTLRFRYIN